MAYDKTERFKCRDCVYHYSVGYDRDRCRLLGKCEKRRLNMKANELMIGDWVCVANGNVKISSVNYQGYAKYRLNECDIAISSDCLDCAEPIQLTKEILKANGWEVMGKDIGMVRCLYRLSDKERIRIYLHYPYMLHYVDDTRTDGYEEREWSIGNITKVHELQHALRICGLDELADNFKLTTTELKKL